ncbi:TPA: alpha/beta fold hydrolase [Escherichia coli]
MTVKVEQIRISGTGGLTLVADSAGPVDGQPVILLHGGGQTRHSWGKALDEFAGAGYRVISYDARGHGDSDWAAEGDYRLDAMVADLAQVIATLSRPPVLIGASMGGASSLLLAGEPGHPAVRALVLVDMVPRMEPAGRARIREFMSAHLEHGFGSLEEAADAVAAYYPERARPKDISGLMKNLRERGDGRLRWHWDPRFTRPAQRPEADVFQARLLRAARGVRVPTLLVRGLKSDMVSQQSVDELREQIPGLELAEVGGAGHMVAGDRNDAFNRDVFSFLRRHTAAGQ